MIFSVFNDGIKWTLDFGSDSFTVAVNDLDQNITITSQELPLAAWPLLLSQRQAFLVNLLPRVPMTNDSKPRRNNGVERRSTLQCGGSRLGHKQLSSIRSQRHRVQLGNFSIGHGRKVIDNLFSPTTFDDFLMEGSVENPIVLDEEEDKENAPPPPSTPESIRPTEPPRLQRTCASGARMENVPDFVFRILFH